MNITKNLIINLHFVRRTTEAEIRAKLRQGERVKE